MFNTRITVTAIAVLIGFHPASATAAGSGRQRAILVGVNEYDHAKLKPLRYSVSDVTALAPLLRQAGYEIDLLTDDEGRKGASRRPTLANIRARLEAVITKSKRTDTLLIGLSGHGLQFGGDHDGYFCPVDADPANRNTLLSLGQLFRNLDDCGGTKLVLVDACRDDPAIGRGIGGGIALQLPDEVAALYSCAVGERALESDKYEHGVFFYHVLQGLQGPAADADGDVTWLSLTAYVKKRVPIDVARLHGGRVSQTPSLRSGEMAGASPVLARRTTARGTAALAILFRAVGEQSAAQFKRAPSQPLVTFVVPGGGGDRLGLKTGDVVLQVDGLDVSTLEETKAAIHNRELADRIELKVARGGQELTLSGLYVTQLLDLQIMSRVRQLAGRDDIEAQTYLGLLLANGQFTIKDAAEAAVWFRKAAEKGHAGAQASLGQMYANGHGVVKDDTRAVAWFRKAADQGNPHGQNGLGWMYANGRNVVRDDATAVAWYCKAIGQGNALAQNNLGLMYRDGRGVAKNDREAMRLFRKAAGQGNAFGQLNLGLMYANGRGVTTDDTEAVAWYRKAAEQGLAAAQAKLGWMYDKGHGVAKDDVAAVAWYRKAADQGNAMGQNDLGVMYHTGRGVTQDDAEAVAWYRKAAEQGNTAAQDNLGWMYAHGCGGNGDDAEAVGWYRKAAEKGHAQAQANLAWMYEKGRGVPKDDSQAVTWYRKAAEQGLAWGQNNLAIMLRDRRGVATDDTEAVAWFRKAAAQGHAGAQLDLGWMYEQGRGVAQDMAQALSWYRKSAEQGNAIAQCNLGLMYENGRGLSKDPTAALNWYRRAAAAGNSRATEALNRFKSDPSLVNR
ncbi:MAG: caspase family protein [Isosphaeraceae bacterium]